MGSRRLFRTAALALVAVLCAAAAAASDPYRSQQWSLDRIGAPQAWTQGVGQGQVVAVIDSGIDLEHPDLVDRLFRRNGVVVGRDYVEDDAVPQDELGHGSMVAGIVAATRDNGIGIAGVAPQARIMPIRVLDEDGRGDLGDVEDAIDWAVENGATIVNLSLESVIRDGDGQPVASTGIGAPVRAVRDAWAAGVIVVAAAGNSGNPFTDYPPTSEVVLVGATDREDQRAEFSDSGRSDMLMAPGVDIVSTWCRPDRDTPCDGTTHKYGIAEGTSFAAPHVAGALAILRSTGLNHEQAIQRLRETARDIGAEGRDLQTGYGLIDLAAATATEEPEPSETPSASPSASPSPSPSPTPSTTPASTDRPTEASPDPAPTVTEPAPTTSPTTADPDDPSPTPAPTDGSDDPTSPTADPSAPAGDPARGSWALLAALLVAGTGMAAGRAMLRQRDDRV